MQFRPGRVFQPRTAPAVARFRSALGDDLTDDDVFFYVYGILHSPDFRRTFESSLKKEKPRIPFVTSRALFDAFAAAGRELLRPPCRLRDGRAVPAHRGMDSRGGPGDQPGPAARRYQQDELPEGIRPRQRPRQARPRPQPPALQRPSHSCRHSRPRPYDYLLGTRSGIDWLIDRYYIKTDKNSRIVNDPNQWGLERGEPRYILDLVKRVVTVSVRTVQIVSASAESRGDDRAAGWSGWNLTSATDEREWAIQVFGVAGLWGPSVR